MRKEGIGHPLILGETLGRPVAQELDHVHSDAQRVMACGEGTLDCGNQPGYIGLRPLHCRRTHDLQLAARQVGRHVEPRGAQPGQDGVARLVAGHAEHLLAALEPQAHERRDDGLLLIFGFIQPGDVVARLQIGERSLRRHTASDHVAMGSVKEKVLPMPTWLSTQIRPPWASTSILLM